jgi:hypothetical protein
VIRENTEMVDKVIKSLPKTIEIKTDRDVYSFPVSDEDFADAHKMVAESGVLKKKGIKPEEVQGNAALHIRVKRFNDIIAEVERVAVARAVEALERGKSGVDVIRQTAPNGNLSKQEAFNKKYGLPT